MSVAAILVPILAEVGAPILKSLLADALPDGPTKYLSGTIIDTIARRLGVEPTPEAIQDAYVANPKTTGQEIREVEQVFGPTWMEQAVAGRDSLLKREDDKSFFHNGWRPTMSWLQIWMWGWNTTLLPLVNAGFKLSLPAVPYDTMVAFGGLWLVIYGGGHTIKSVFGKEGAK